MTLVVLRTHAMNINKTFRVTHVLYKVHMYEYLQNHTTASALYRKSIFDRMPSLDTYSFKQSIIYVVLFFTGFLFQHNNNFTFSTLKVL